jgi:hypothetical protein
MQFWRGMKIRLQKKAGLAQWMIGKRTAPPVDRAERTEPRT